MTTDVLVIGSGIAGLSYAIELAERRKDLAITIISKREAFESNTKYAQGGIAVVQDFAADSFEKHVADTLEASDGLADLKVVEKVVKQGPERLKQLMRWGAEFDRLSEDAALELGKEGGHNAHRIVHHKDRSGYEIQRALIERLKALSNISLLENHTLVDLITDHHHNQAPKKACYGAYVISLESLSVIKITAQVTVLSTGGAAQVYAYSTNPESATGDGIAAAYRAKVRIENLHYVQFHPTALAVEVGGAPFLISEAVRGFGGHLLNDAGQRFVFDYDPRGELASRDIVSRAIELEMKKQGSSHVHLSLKHLEAQAVLQAFPSIAENCLKVGIDITIDLIPVRPAAHYFCGGIDVNLNAKTSLSRLYAIGECSHTGLHGANRLASNSLLEALVYAHSAVESTLDTLTEGTIASAYFEAIPEWNHAHSIIDRQSEELKSLKKGVQELMSDKVGIFKTTATLTQAEKELEYFYLRTQAIYSQNKLTPQLLELRNMVNVGYLIIKQAQQATENKGVFIIKTMLNTQSAAFESALKQFITLALAEDIGSGDASALACLDPNAFGAADCLIKAQGVIAGIDLARRIFAHYDQRIRFTPYLDDGDSIQEGAIAFRVEGPQASLLSTERLVLNCLQRMSGIATLTHKVQQLIAHTNCRVLDTRKTTPNFRIAEKWAVQIGGGENHRMGLYDMIMLKDNHIDYAGGVAQAIEKTLAYLKRQSKNLPIVVETRTIEEVDACLDYQGRITRILLDNMSTVRLREALAWIDGRIPTEASGGINLSNVVSIAETGVDYVSMGSIIYSAEILDMSLKAVNR